MGIHISLSLLFDHFTMPDKVSPTTPIAPIPKGRSDDEMQGGKAPAKCHVPLVAAFGASVLTSVGLLVGVIVLALQGKDDTMANATGGYAPITLSTDEKKIFCTSKPSTVVTNPCAGTKPTSGFDNKDCFIGETINALEQAGGNITKGYVGELNTTAVPILTPYHETGLCPVNVHWHLGTEHLSVGQYDETGSGPTEVATRRRAAGKVREGFQCVHYDPMDKTHTTPYDWKHCKDMEVGQTYEVHWPHSKGGACGTIHQFQTPFYDGVFCYGSKLVPSTQEAIGVQAQVFMIVNDEDHYYPDLMRGMISDDTHGIDMGVYTGSTTGTSRSNTICSAYSPITWQVDRTCHKISASTFDKMCADMKAQNDDMTDDLHAHGSRELVDSSLVADNHQDLP